jgi:hypothetical protein
MAYHNLHCLVPYEFLLNNNEVVSKGTLVLEVK